MCLKVLDLSQPDQLCTYSSPNPTLTLICYKLTVVGLGTSRCRVAQILTSIKGFSLSVFSSFYMVKSVLTSKIATLMAKLVLRVSALNDWS